MIYIIWVYQEVYETVGHTFIQALQVTFGSPKKGVSDGQTYFFCLGFITSEQTLSN